MPKADGYSLTVHGLEEVFQTVKDLPGQAIVPTIRKGFAAAGKRMLGYALAAVPRLTGRLAESLRYSIRTYPTRGWIVLWVGTAAKWFTGETFYAGFVEWGHMVGKRPSRLSRKALTSYYARGAFHPEETRTQFVKGREFIKEAYERERPYGAQLIVQDVKAAVEKYLAKAARAVAKRGRAA